MCRSPRRRKHSHGGFCLNTATAATNPSSSSDLVRLPAAVCSWCKFGAVGWRRRREICRHPKSCMVPDGTDSAAVDNPPPPPNASSGVLPGFRICAVSALPSSHPRLRIHFREASASASVNNSTSQPTTYGETSRIVSWQLRPPPEEWSQIQRLQFLKIVGALYYQMTRTQR